MKSYEDAIRHEDKKLGSYDDEKKISTSQPLNFSTPQLHKFGLLLLTAYCLLTAVVNAQEPRPFLTDKDQFNYAMFLYKQGHYEISAREFGRVIDYFPGSQIIPHAQYMIGDAYLSASKYQEAVNQLQQFIKNFPAN
ncbi:MAG TPA: hypothetical protein DCL42_09215, partial [Deltaproteobacteria bacterium]|nr:hypothetical protein [Deltaproteobacteria bacterium]